MKRPDDYHWMRGSRGYVELGQRSKLTAKDIQQTNLMYKCKECGRQVDASNWISVIDHTVTRGQSGPNVSILPLH